jgi:ribosomal protein S18 acetylase RimI-like enzyme
MASHSVMIKSIEGTDRPWLKQFLGEQWGSHLVVSRGRLIDASLLPGFILRQSLGGDRLGVLTYEIRHGQCEVVTLDSLEPGMGIGTRLIEAILQTARQMKCKRLFLITTNDNTPALRFYQRRGFHLAALHPNAIEESRRLKPSIPLLGLDDIPIRDEVELEILLE